MTILRTYIDIIEAATRPDIKISVRVSRYADGHGQAVEPSDVPRAFIFDLPAQPSKKEFERSIRQQILSVTGFAVDEMEWSVLDA